jgi:Asp-tRNA(Asn)/Glu-tRNA(Gln) amidotransferase A subunit family amidase
MEPSELDANTIRHMGQRQGSQINAQKLCKKIEAIDNHEHDFDFSDLLTISQKGDGYLQKAAKYIIMRAYVDKFGDSVQASEYAQMALRTVRYGCLWLMQLDRYYRFEPCMRRMFELNAEKTQKLVNLYHAYMQSKYKAALDQSFHKLRDNCDGMTSVSENADEIHSGLESYNYAMDVVERGLPLLTGFKRILDANDEPDLDKLQKLRLGPMMKELTNKSSENYCYFDQIVDIIDRDIRNAIAHGDTFVNPSESIVESPNADTNYQFSTMSNKLEDIYAVSIFLSGTYQHNIPACAVLEESELDQWDILPTHS